MLNHRNRKPIVFLDKKFMVEVREESWVVEFASCALVVASIVYIAWKMVTL